MATPTIPNGEEHFFPIIYEGNGTGQRVGKFVPFTDNGTIANSLIFNHPDEPELSRTPSSGGNRRTFTISAWIKLGSQFGQRRMLFSQAVSGNVYFLIEFDASNKLFVSANDGSIGADLNLTTTRTFEDTSKFYHITLAVDTTQSTASDRVKLYVDGDQITSFSTATYFGQNYDTQVNHTVEAAVGNWISTGYATDGYIAEFNLVDGTALTPDTFGLTDTSTGRWIPKTLTGITYGTNGFRLQFGSSSALGDDTSGNENDFSVTNLVAGDQTTDSPTQNFNNMGGSDTGGFTKVEGNLKITIPSSGAYEQCVGLSSFGVNSGKWYWEVKIDSKGQSGFGWKSDDSNGGAIAKDTGGNLGTVYVVGTSGGFADGEWTDDYTSGLSNFSPFTTASNNDVIMFALDLDNQKGYVGLNGTWFNSANPANGTGSIGLGYLTKHSPNAKFYPMCLRSDSATTATYNFGATSFAYTPPTGFLKWQQDNLPETAKGITGVAWAKSRDSVGQHVLRDSSRGLGTLFPSLTSAESQAPRGITKFLKGGYALGEDDLVGGSNNSGESYVSWNWVANGGVTSTNNDGSITSTVQVNSDAGFSIVQGKYFQGTMGHGLSQTPEWIIYKEISPNANNWYVWHKDLTSTTYYLFLDSSQAQANEGTTLWAPTSTTFSTNLSLSGDRDAIAYCWHGVDGFSKFGKYTGNGSSDDGPFIYTGFKPAFLMYKGITEASQWDILDNKRNAFNPQVNVLSANLTNADRTPGSYSSIDFLSNGFKIRALNDGINKSGNEFIYMAFAEHPFVGDGTNPVTAR